jgi:hypothetical protein
MPINNTMTAIAPGVGRAERVPQLINVDAKDLLGWV